ncbi:cytochrome c-type biogenesis protein [Comamonas sp. NLF-1-9]|uniref:cytochrome c-type biogenesis protein n=1 Tax=Comamonas sp. NLF-1-9 TaxID=2853163 RepID=UPI001C492C6D|nr:cytochrome c-type biogenesis protein [Comamonas sp. NLF-1-9]QXL85940.1 cytochrome c-type biogenesis protein CcmH [Comamonas sp. NLF-1-9]
MLVLLAWLGASGWASEAPTLAADPALEARMMDIAHELRCLVCQNETIAASHADLAVDLRQQIRKQLEQGRTPAQIREFMVQRYGEFVLYRPRLTAKTLLLWGGPFVLLLLGLFVLWRALGNRPGTPEPAALTPQEEQKAQQLLGLAKEKD